MRCNLFGYQIHLKRPALSEGRSQGMRPYRSIDLETIIHKITNAHYFSFPKINHGFWENLRDWFILSKQGVTAEAFEAHRRLKYLIETDFHLELLAQLQKLDGSDPALLFAMSPLAYPDSREREGTPIEFERVCALMEETVSEKQPIYDGLFWKNCMLDGSLLDFFKQINHHKVLVVGPKHLKDLEGMFDLKDFHHLLIPLHDARKVRHEIEAQIRKFRETHQGPLLILFQASTLAAWLIFRLHRQLPKTWMLDMGRALDISCPSIIRNQNWVKIHGATVYQLWHQSHPDWLKVPAPKLLKQSEPPETIAFLQDKSPDSRSIDHLLALSRQQNHWTNFGPVSKKLEQTIQETLELPAEKAVITCNNATSGLFVWIGLQNLIFQRKLRWVTSAYSFFSTTIGNLADVSVLDCDQTGMLSLKQLQALPSDTYDGVIVTNLFGAAANLNDYADFCRDNEKLLLVDNAYGFDIGHRDRYMNEIISFHHTKPWGFGEGGCVITHRDQEQAVRALLNFGVGLGDEARPFALNGKLSEVNAAFILDRIQNMPYWSYQYRLQYRRIALMAAELDLNILLPSNITGNRIDPLGRRGMLTSPYATPAHVPLILDGPTEAAPLKNMPLPIMKYYKPLANEEIAPQAHEIYRRIVNVPCHSDVRHFSNQALRELLTHLKQITSQT